jgi:hypothetical protein
LLKRLLKYNRINEQIWRKWYTSFLGNQLDINFVNTASLPQPQNLSAANDLGNVDKDKLDWWIERTSNEMFNRDIIPLMNALNDDKGGERIKYQACSLIIVGITIVDNSKGEYHIIDDFPDEFRIAFESACILLNLPPTPAGLNAILSQSGGMRSKITSKKTMGNMRRAKLNKRPTRESIPHDISTTAWTEANKNLSKSKLDRNQIFLNTISYYIKNNILNYCKTDRWNEAYKDINICLYHLFNIMKDDELLLDDLKPYTTEELEGELNMEDLEGGNISVKRGSYNNSQKGGEKNEQDLIEDMNKYITENAKTHPQDFLNNIKIYTTINYRFYKIVNITRIITKIQRIFRERRRISSIDRGSKKYIKKKSKKKKSKKKKSKKRKSDKKKSKKKKTKKKK